jgi:hypothetical protein
MPGEMHLETILQTLSPRLLDGDYVFCSLPEAKYGDLASLSPLASVQEPEGLTLVVRAVDAEREHLEGHGLFRCIRLEVHSSLESVGLTARLSTALAEQGISANILAGAHHDHILVPQARALDALATLRQLNFKD